MPKLWLPTSYTIKEPTSGRERIIIIPGAEHMDVGQLREILLWQEEKTKAELKALGPKPIARLSKEEVQGALREYRDWLKKKGAR